MEKPTPTLEIESGRFYCPHCPNRYTTVGDKKRHMKDEHKVLMKTISAC